MKRAIFLLAALACLVPAKDVPMAVVVRLKGRAWIGPSGNLKPAKSGDVVSRNWTVKTESDGEVVMRLLADKTLADVKPSSVVLFDATPGNGAGSVQDVAVLAGQASFLVPATSNPDKSRTATTVTTASNAQYGMSAAANGTTRVDVLAGTIKVCNQMTGEHLPLSGGQTVTSTYDGFGSVGKVSADSSLARLALEPVKAVANDSSETVKLLVPFTDPVTGKSSVLSVDVRRRK